MNGYDGIYHQHSDICLRKFTWGLPKPVNCGFHEVLGGAIVPFTSVDPEMGYTIYPRPTMQWDNQ